MLVPIVVFTLFALVLGARTLLNIVATLRQPPEVVAYLGTRKMTLKQVIKGIYDYQSILDSEGGLNARQTATYHGLCAIAGVKPEDL